MAEIEVDKENAAQAGVAAGTKETAEDIFEGKTQDAADSGEPQEGEDAQLPFHKHPRFQQVIREKNEAKQLADQYKELGTPEELSKKLETVGELQGYVALLTDKISDLEAKREEGEPKSKKQREFEEVRKEARAELSKIAPEVDAIHKLAVDTEIQYRARERAANKETVSILREAGYSTGQQDVVQTASMLADIIGQDEDLYLEYMTNPRGAVRQAWNQLTKRFSVERSVKAQVEQDKKELAKLPKAHTGTGGTERGVPPTPPKTLREAEKRATARLQGMK